MGIAYLLTGSNLGERASCLQKANVLIEQSCGKILYRSALYETAPWGLLEQPSFLNQAIAVETTLNPEELMQTLLKIETQMGRIREVLYGPRIIDLDILLFDQVIMDQPILKLPHPALQQRRFALTPLAEIAPALLHPVLKKNILELLAECPDQSDVQKKM
ncbi:MAG TPA: 2-amino-4-hydroxy-6-hydroxymethyldihydropteridine diphosphokinase [Sediminibacterium sp.]|nr:2-amino-4-hydroxy-6-hydroxymethyldihydropteridine diphosphokinase [Sediminibacterium sp.]